MVEHPGEYRWSSYRANAQGELNALLTPHPLYTALAGKDGARQATYRDLFRHQLDPGSIDELRAATNGNYALGNPPIQAQIAAALDRRVTPGQSGRPRKNEEPESLELFNDC